MNHDEHQEAGSNRGSLRGSSGFALKHRGLVLWTWLVMCWETLWPRLVPLFMLVCALLTITWFGGWHFLNTQQNLAIDWASRLLLAALFLLALLPLKNFKAPRFDGIVRRIEDKSKLEDRPITAQEDKLAMGKWNNTASVLWEEHQRRMSERLQDMTAGNPHPDSSKTDPHAIRAILPILAVSAFLFSFSPQGGTVSDILYSRSSSELAITRMDAWIDPPRYTKVPPIYLTRGSTTQASAASASLPGTVTAPVGSSFFLRFIGNGDVSLLTQSTEDASPEKVDGASTETDVSEFRFDLSEPQTVLLEYEGQVVSQWRVELTADVAPTISFDETPSGTLSGSTELSYSVTDDYGVVGATAYFNPVDKQDSDARPLVEAPKIELPLPRHRAKSGASRVTRDLTEHPWAGSKVRITLEAADDIGQRGTSDSREITLPGRQFSKPLSLALVEQRRILAMDARKQRRVADMLDAVSSAPPQYIDNTNAYIAMRVAYRRIVDARNDDQLRDSLDLLWDIALGIEFGDLSEAERKFREAQERLNKALEDGATDEEISKLMQELRQAMNEMLQAMAEEARRNPQSENPFSRHDQLQTLTQRDLDRMMDRIEDLARSGSEDAARQLLNEMQRMMDNLRAGRHEQQRRSEGNEFNQSLDELSKLMQRQQELMDETYRMQRRQREGGQDQQGRQHQQNQQGQGQQNQQQGESPNGNQQGQMTPEELAEALKQLQQQQEALQKELQELGQKLEDLGLEPSQEFGEAGEQMGDAARNLGQGETGQAGQNQSEALNSLRQGAQSMMEQMAGDRQSGGAQARRGGQGQNPDQSGNDPLGRRVGENGQEFGSDVEIPGEIDAQRAREILEAIRKRLAIPENPLVERDYLERLLNTR